MSLHAKILPVVLLLAPSTDGSAQDAAYRVSGPSLANLTLESVRLVGPSTTEVPALVGCQFLPLIPSGHAAVHAADPTRPQPVTVGPGVPALRLPDRPGTLIVHYRRSGSTFGFAALLGDGRVRVLLERPGLGPGQTIDPFEPIVGVSPDATRIAVSAPEFDDVGYTDAWLLAVRGTLAGGVVARELTGPGDDEVDGISFTFFQGELWCVFEDRLANCPDDGSAGLQVVAIPPSGGSTALETSEELLVSADGSTLVFLAGIDEALADLYVVDAAGIRNVTGAPSELTPPGWIPEEELGPYLGVSADGSVVAFLREIAGEDEVFLQATAPGSTPVQVTGDAIFDTSIDNPSGLLGDGLARFRFFADSGNQNADLYQAELLPGGGLATKNLTQTSGVSAPVYPNAATIDIETSVEMTTGRSVVDDRTGVGGGFDLHHVDGAGAGGLVLAGLTAPPVWSSGRTGRYVGRVELPAFDLVVEVDGGAAPRAVIAPPPGVRFDEVRAGTGGRVIHFVADVGGLDFVGSIHRDTGALALAPGGPYANAAGVGFSEQGRILFSAAGAGGTTTYAVAADGSFTAPVGAPSPIAGWLD
ncbi:MAG: TolB family protein [Planctomycetota bacterium JB042]